MLRRVGVALAVLAVWAPAANATQTTQTFRIGPIKIGPYGVDEKDYAYGIPGPAVNGYLTGGSARVVDTHGKPLSIAQVMLHHAVFSNAGSRIGEKSNPTCSDVTLFDSLTHVPAVAEPVGGFAEEHVNEHLPPGYGYPIKSTDQWVATWMLMNHQSRPWTIYLEYTADIVSGEGLKPAYPVWLDVRDCGLDPIFDVPGGGARGSTYSVSTTRPMPFTGRIVAALGHLHGGGRSDVLSEPECGDRELLRSVPTWGGPRSVPYRVRPVLHEPSPIGMSTVTSEQGFPVHEGETLKLTANYDAALPHTRVMGIMGLFITPDPNAGKSACGSLPTDVHVDRMPGPETPPAFRMPTHRLPGRTVLLSRRGAVDVSKESFSPAKVAVRAGTTVRWHFWDDALHNVTVTGGPGGFSSPNLNAGRDFQERLTKPGVYHLYCSLHPAWMYSTVTVLPRRR